MNTADAYRKGWDDFKAGVNSPPKELDVYDIVAWSQGRETVPRPRPPQSPASRSKVT